MSIEKISITARMLRSEYDRVQCLWADGSGKTGDTLQVAIWYIVSQLLDETEYLLNNGDRLFSIDAKLFLSQCNDMIDQLKFYE